MCSLIILLFVPNEGAGSWDIHSVTGGGGNSDKDDNVTEVSKYFKGPIGP